MNDNKKMRKNIPTATNTKSPPSKKANEQEKSISKDER